MSSPTDDWYRDQIPRLTDEGEYDIECAPDAPVSRGNGKGAWVQAWVWVPDPPQPRGPRYTLLGCEPLDQRGTPSAWFSLCGTGLGYGGYEGDSDGSRARRAAHVRAKELRRMYACGKYRPPGPLLVAVVPAERARRGITPRAPRRFPTPLAKGDDSPEPTTSTQQS